MFSSYFIPDFNHKQELINERETKHSPLNKLLKKKKLLYIYKLHFQSQIVNHFNIKMINTGNDTMISNLRANEIKSYG